MSTSWLPPALKRHGCTSAEPPISNFHLGLRMVQLRNTLSTADGMQFLSPRTTLRWRCILAMH